MANGFHGRSDVDISFTDGLMYWHIEILQGSSPAILGIPSTRHCTQEGTSMARRLFKMCIGKSRMTDHYLKKVS